jgi:hypothetical protein
VTNGGRTGSREALYATDVRKRAITNFRERYAPLRR